MTEQFFFLKNWISVRNILFLVSTKYIHYLHLKIIKKSDYICISSWLQE